MAPWLAIPLPSGDVSCRLTPLFAPQGLVNAHSQHQYGYITFTDVITRRILCFPRQAKTQYQCLKYSYGAFMPLLYCRDRLEKNLRAPYPNRTGIRCLEGTCVTFTPMVQILDTLIIYCYPKYCKIYCCMCRQSDSPPGNRTQSVRLRSRAFREPPCSHTPTGYKRADFRLSPEPLSYQLNAYPRISRRDGISSGLEVLKWYAPCLSINSDRASLYALLAFSISLRAASTFSASALRSAARASLRSFSSLRALSFWIFSRFSFSFAANSARWQSSGVSKTLFNFSEKYFNFKTSLCFKDISR